ncbi:MAG: ribonuclease III [Holosporaceae bacterium]|jgi:ribonuclease-3|nr:ribonuclease III [Holosporaceae bacterium]
MAALDGVAKLQDAIGYKFKHTDAAEIAISHPGLKKGDKTLDRNFERLEFLGDRVLGLSLSYFLYERFPDDDEGDLAIRMATLASTDFLINLSKKTKIIDCFSIPRDFFVSDGKNSSSIADMFEAVLGAVFLDSDFETAKEIVFRLWKEDVDNVIYKKKDSKSQLQEIAQAKYCKLPIYRLIKMVGEAHDPIFEIEVTACGTCAVGCGNSKKNAEHDAASKLIKKLEEIN